MEFHVGARSYKTFGGHPSLGLIGDFLLQGAGHFGDAVKELEFTLHVPNSGQPLASLESMWNEHEIHRATLPKLIYSRKKGAMNLHISSEAMTSDDWKPGSSFLSLSTFKRGVDEILHALPLMKTRLKASDDFDLKAFVAHCEAARQRIPESDQEFETLAAKLRAAEETKRAAMSDWEKLGIDWDDFHPRAREILDDPFYWDCTNDFSPNGNDTGADLLENYRDWLKKHRGGQPLRFLERLAKQWSDADLGDMEADTRDEACVGLAFADLKLRGMCDPDSKQFALEAIERQRDQAKADATWAHRDERLKALELLESKLRQA